MYIQTGCCDNSNCFTLYKSITAVAQKTSLFLVLYCELVFALDVIKRASN